MSELEDKNSTTKSPAETGNPLIHDLNAEPETPIIGVDGKLVGNMLVGQSGGPTAVINASVAGVIQEAGKYPDQIVEIYFKLIRAIYLAGPVRTPKRQTGPRGALDVASRAANQRISRTAAPRHAGSHGIALGAPVTV